MPDKQAIVLSAGILLVIVVTLVSGCCTCWGVGTGKFVFLERSTGEITTETITGGDPFPQPVPSAAYSYDDATGKLQVLDSLNFYNHYSGLKVFYGEKALFKIGGHVDGSYIQELPYQDKDVKITGVDDNGTVHFSYKDLDKTLKAGESWSGEAYSVTVEAQGTNGAITMNVTRVDTFTNYGLLDATSVAG